MFNLSGNYKFFRSGELVAERQNIIVNGAKAVLLDFLSGRTRSWAGAIAVGISSTAPVATNTHLNFEIARSEINVVEPDYAGGLIVAKATLPLNLIGELYEVGMFNARFNPNEDSNSYIVNYFSPEFDLVVGATEVEGRLGKGSSRLTLVAGTGTFSVEEIGVVLNSLSWRDTFRFAYDATNITSVTLRFYNEDATFRSYQFTPTAGFNVREFTVGEVTGTGTFDSPITRIEVVVAGSVGGTLTAEGLRFHSATLDEEDILMSHAALVTPVVKDAGEEMDIEFSMTFGGLNA